MAYNWTQITYELIELITNLFLYGRATTPTNLTSETLIRPLNDHPRISLKVARVGRNN